LCVRIASLARSIFGSTVFCVLKREMWEGQRSNKRTRRERERHRKRAHARRREKQNRARVPAVKSFASVPLKRGANVPRKRLTNRTNAKTKTVRRRSSPLVSCFFFFFSPLLNGQKALAVSDVVSINTNTRWYGPFFERSSGRIWSVVFDCFLRAHL